MYSITTPIINGTSKPARFNAIRKRDAAADWRLGNALLATIIKQGTRPPCKKPPNSKNIIKTTVELLQKATAKLIAAAAPKIA